MLPLVMMLFITLPEAPAADNPTFVHVDDVSGEPLLCELCPPGFHMRAPCTRTNGTACAPCPSGTFTQFPNYLYKCLYCSNFCVDDEVVKEECSPTRNRVCECAEGYYLQDGLCVRHTLCSAGYGAVQIGTAHRDTECQRCTLGTFSPKSSSTGQCVSHTDCGELLLLLKGTNQHDNICASCADLKNKGEMAFLRDILTGFFTYEKLKLSKLKRFVSLIGQKWQPSNKQNYINLITKWTEQANTHQMKKLPEILRSSGLNRVANKLKGKIKEFTERVSKCDIHNAKM